MLIGEKWRVKQDLVLDAIKKKCGVDLNAVTTTTEIETAIETMEELRFEGIPEATNTD